MVDGWLMHEPAIGQCSFEWGTVMPIGVITYSSGIGSLGRQPQSVRHDPVDRVNSRP